MGVPGVSGGPSPCPPALLRKPGRVGNTPSWEQHLVCVTALGGTAGGVSGAGWSHFKSAEKRSFKVAGTQGKASGCDSWGNEMVDGIPQAQRCHRGLGGTVAPLRRDIQHPNSPSQHLGAARAQPCSASHTGGFGVGLGSLRFSSTDTRQSQARPSPVSPSTPPPSCPGRFSESIQERFPFWAANQTPFCANPRSIERFQT